MLLIGILKYSRITEIKFIYLHLNSSDFFRDVCECTLLFVFQEKICYEQTVRDFQHILQIYVHVHV